MYGIINKAIQDLAIKQGGEQIWEKICTNAKCSDSSFLLSQPYEDAITFRLVAAAAQEFDIPAQTLLRDFGKHWISYTRGQGYSSLMGMFGSNMREFIGNLNGLHSQLFAAMPEAKPPHFTVVADDGSSFVVQYRSERVGLAPMVQGLLEGLADHFNQRCEVKTNSLRNDAQDYDEFVVTVLSES